MSTNIVQCSVRNTDNSGIALAKNLMRPLNFNVFDVLPNFTTNPLWKSNSDIIQAAVLLQFSGLPNYQDIEELNADPLFYSSVGKISPETYRQRLDYLAQNKEVRGLIDGLNVEFLKGKTIQQIEFNGQKYYTLDIDVTPFEDDSHKEGISWTYKGHNGYSPIMAYLGNYALKFDLRPGSQHSENGAIEFLEKCFDMIEKIGIPLEQILVRVDSGHDDSKFMNFCEKKGVKCIVKRNLRGKDNFIAGKVMENTSPVYDDNKPECPTYHYVDSNCHQLKSEYDSIITVYKVETKMKDSNNQDWLVGPLYQTQEVEGYWTNLNLAGEDGSIDMNKRVSDIVDLYHKHAESEQYHSEVKTDMDLELLPSKYFATNAIFLQLAVIAFNLLREIGKIALSIDNNLQHRKSRRVKRIRLKTVINKLCAISSRVVTHARDMVLQFGTNFFLFSTFYKVFEVTLRPRRS